MSWTFLFLLALVTGAVLLLAAVTWNEVGVVAATAPMRTVSQTPWAEVLGTIVNGETVQSSFSGQAGQVVSIDAFMPLTLTMKGEVRLLQNPADGQTAQAGQVIQLQGQAYDPEEGHLQGSALVWMVAGMGEVGSGREASIFGLDPGDYQITLCATDGDGLSRDQTVTVHVLEGPGGAVSHTVYLPLVVR